MCYGQTDETQTIYCEIGLDQMLVEINLFCNQAHYIKKKTYLNKEYFWFSNQTTTVIPLEWF